jgi:hypothetical protein
MKDTGSHHEQGRSSPARAGGATIFISGAAVPAAGSDVDFNIRQAEWYLTLLQGQITSTLPQQQVTPTPATPAPATA